MDKGILYSNGVVSSLMQNLISKENFNRMIEAKSKEETLKILYETKSVTNIDENLSINEILNFKLTSLINFVKDNSPSEDFTNFFLLPYDYNNIINYFKCLKIGQDFSKNFCYEGMYSKTQIEDYISSGNYKLFNNNFIVNAILEFNKINQNKFLDGWEFEYIFKHNLYKNLLSVSKKNKLLSEILDYQITIENLSVCLQSKSLYEFESQLLDGGFLSKSELIQIFNKEIAILQKPICQNIILKKFLNFVLQNNKEKDFAFFETLKNNMEVYIINQHSDCIESIVPFMLYCYLVVMEIKNIRLIISFQENNLRDKIKKRFLEGVI